MATDPSEFGTRAAALRAFDPSARDGKARLKQLRSDHGGWLASFIRDSLDKKLPRQASTADEAPPPLLTCARDAAHLMLWLGVSQAPEPQRFCHNVAFRCLALHQPAAAAEVSAAVVRSLREEVPRGKAKKPCAAPASADEPLGPWPLASAAGGEPSAVCETCLSALVRAAASLLGENAHATCPPTSHSRVQHRCHLLPRALASAHAVPRRPRRFLTSADCPPARAHNASEW